MALHHNRLACLALNSMSARKVFTVNVAQGKLVHMASSFLALSHSQSNGHLTAVASCDRCSAVSRVQSRLVLLSSMLAAKKLASSEGSSSSVTAVGHASAVLLKLVNQEDAAPC